MARSETPNGRQHPPLRLWVIAAVLLAVGVAYSYSRLPAGEEFSVLFFCRWMLLPVCLSAFTMALLDPRRWMYWILPVGLFPMAAVIVYMVFRGPGNLWPIALGLAFAAGMIPAAVGAALGRGIRWLISRVSPDSNSAP